MAKRPEFCKEANCPIWGWSRCAVDIQINDNYKGKGSVKLRRDERMRLLNDAKQNPNIIIQKCAES